MAKKNSHNLPLNFPTPSKKMKGLVIQSYLALVTGWIVAHQAPVSMEISSKNTRVGSHSLLQGIFPTQGLNPGLLHCRQITDVYKSNYYAVHLKLRECCMSIISQKNWKNGTSLVVQW